MSRKTLSAALALAGLAVGAAQAQVVVRDAETGQLRAPTAAEAAELAAKAKPSSSAATAGVQRALPGGGVALMLDESSMVYSVARVNAQGAVERECVTGGDAATRALQARKSFATPIKPAMTTARGAAYELK